MKDTVNNGRANNNKVFQPLTTYDNVFLKALIFVDLIEKLTYMLELVVQINLKKGI
ncbi:hypothetical protein CSCA_2078 [Clostridium scatologenes]|uniref:Uncharacterized protein n=1 Tax=Clostridium scatologenes TaxID=1548 RepID=A0A0E3M7U7_CLOSL|nr:hypothetical protein CSCA_2078 [Clostridium scatologenes]